MNYYYRAVAKDKTTEDFETCDVVEEKDDRWIAPLENGTIREFLKTDYIKIISKGFDAVQIA